MDYSTLKVAQLKEQAKARGLSVGGSKQELINRLKEADSKGELDDEEEKKPEEAAKPELAQPEPQTEAVKEQPEAEQKPEAQTEQKEANGQPEGEKQPEKPVKKELSPDELKQLAVEHLTTKIKRAEKFGDETLAEAARRDLRRVEKFGVDKGTALARELTGQPDRPLGSKKRSRKGGKNRVKK